MADRSTEKPTILILGAGGQLGFELRALAPSLGRILPVTRRECDLNDIDRLRALLQEARPDCILNAAAYTAVDKAETDAAAAERLNALVPAELASYSGRNRCTLVHFSTDYVFAGDRPGAYTEEDEPHPGTVYGATKRRGELEVLHSEADAYVLRLSWVFGSHGNNFPKTILRLARERETLNVVHDQKGRPTPARLAAEITMEILSRKFSGRPLPTGLYHLAARGETTWYEFARRIVEIGRETDPGGLKAQLRPITTAEYPTAARRPLNSVLDCSKLETQLGRPLPHWGTYLEPVVTAEISLTAGSKKGKDVP